MTRAAPIAIGFAALSLALSLSACKQDAAGAGSTASTDKIAPVAAPAGKAWAETVATTPEGGYLMGNPAAPIKVVEFGSLTCSHCAEFAEKGSAALRDQYIASGRVSYEFRNFVRDPIDIAAAMLVRCGPPQGFFALTDQVFANQPETFKKWDAIGQPAQQATMAQPPAKRFIALAQATGLTDFFAARGVAKPQAEACLADTAKAQTLATATDTAGTQYEIAGTPTFLINGKKVDTNTWDDTTAGVGIQTLLERAGAR